MLSTSHPELKSKIVNACLEIFPEAQCISLWGGCVTPDFSPNVSDVDLIIELNTDFSKEVVLAERLKALIQITGFCRLDPFVYLSEVPKDEPLEFIAPFGFYKANPFIPYLIHNQHEVIHGESRLLKNLPQVSLADALLGILPTAMGALKRLRMDAHSEQAWAPLAAKHKASLFVVARTYFALEQGGVGSKKEALRFLAKKMPQYQSLFTQLSQMLEPVDTEIGTSEDPSVETILSFVKDLEHYFHAVRKRESAQ